MVTGGAGFIGSHLAEALARDGAQVISSDGALTDATPIDTATPDVVLDAEPPDAAPRPYPDPEGWTPNRGPGTWTQGPGDAHEQYLGPGMPINNTWTQGPRDPGMPVNCTRGCP